MRDRLAVPDLAIQAGGVDPSADLALQVAYALDEAGPDLKDAMFYASCLVVLENGECELCLDPARDGGYPLRDVTDTLRDQCRGAALVIVDARYRPPPGAQDDDEGDQQAGVEQAAAVVEAIRRSVNPSATGVELIAAARPVGSHSERIPSRLTAGLLEAIDSQEGPLTAQHVWEHARRSSDFGTWPYATTHVRGAPPFEIRHPEQVSAPPAPPTQPGSAPAQAAQEEVAAEEVAAAAAAEEEEIPASTRYLAGEPATSDPAASAESAMVGLVQRFPTLGQIPVPELRWLVSRIDGAAQTIAFMETLATRHAGEAAEVGQELGSWRESLEPLLPAEGPASAQTLLPAVLGALRPEALSHLVRCSILAEPAPWGGIVALEDVPGTSSVICEAGLLTPVASPESEPGAEEFLWAPDPFVVEALREIQIPAELVAAHRRVGSWFAARYEVTKDRALAKRAVGHLAAGGDGDAAWPLARALVLGLRRQGRYREALSWVERVAGADPSGPQRGLALTFRVQLGGLAGAPPAEAEQWLAEAKQLVDDSDRAFVLEELGKLHKRQGRLEEAARTFEEAVEVGLAARGDNRQAVAAALHSLGMLLQTQGDLDGARETLERALRLKTQLFGTEHHAEVAATMHALAGVLQTQGVLGGAKLTLEQALRIKAEVFGTEQHPSVAASLHALAGVLQEQEDYAGAKETLERALRIKVEVFGTEQHPSVAASLHALGSVLRGQGDLEGARTTLERSLAITIQGLGSEQHPEVAASLHALAGVLEAQGDLAAAREKLEQVLQIEAAVYATREHYSTALTEMSLAALLVQQGETARGRELLQHAHAVFQRQFGDQHGWTEQAARRLALLVE